MSKTISETAPLMYYTSGPQAMEEYYLSPYYFLREGNMRDVGVGGYAQFPANVKRYYDKMLKNNKAILDPIDARDLTVNRGKSFEVLQKYGGDTIRTQEPKIYMMPTLPSGSTNPAQQANQLATANNNANPGLGGGSITVQQSTPIYTQAQFDETNAENKRRYEEAKAQNYAKNTTLLFENAPMLETNGLFSRVLDAGLLGTDFDNTRVSTPNTPLYNGTGPYDLNADALIPFGDIGAAPTTPANITPSDMVFTEYWPKKKLREGDMQELVLPGMNGINWKTGDPRQPVAATMPATNPNYLPSPDPTNQTSSITVSKSNRSPSGTNTKNPLYYYSTPKWDPVSSEFQTAVTQGNPVTAYAQVRNNPGVTNEKFFSWEATHSHNPADFPAVRESPDFLYPEAPDEMKVPASEATRMHLLYNRIGWLTGKGIDKLSSWDPNKPNTSPQGWTVYQLHDGTKGMYNQSDGWGFEVTKDGKVFDLGTSPMLDPVYSLGQDAKGNPQWVATTPSQISATESTFDEATNDILAHMKQNGGIKGTALWRTAKEDVPTAQSSEKVRVDKEDEANQTYLYKNAATGLLGHYLGQNETAYSVTTKNGKKESTPYTKTRRLPLGSYLVSRATTDVMTGFDPAKTGYSASDISNLISKIKAANPDYIWDGASGKYLSVKDYRDKYPGAKFGYGQWYTK